MASSSTSAATVLPTHTTTSTKPPPPRTPHPHPRRRCLCVCLLTTLAVLLLLALLLLILSLTVLRVRDPTTRLLSTRLAGLSPRLTFPAASLQLNVTLLLTVAVHNPNPASFAYGPGGRTELTYRGAQVGDASIDPGRIPSRGDANVSLALTVQADRLAADLAQLIADVESGDLEMEAATRVPGRVTVLGIFSRRAVAISDCTFVVDVVGMRVRSQQCRDRTKL